MVEDDDDKHLLLLLPIVIFLLITIGGSMALNMPVNETKLNSSLDLEYNKNFPYVIEITGEKNQNIYLKIGNYDFGVFKDKNVFRNKNNPHKPVQAAPDNITENITISGQNKSNDSSLTAWNLNGTKTVYLTSDNVIDKNTDMKFLKRIAYNLEKNGINVVIDRYAPNPNQVARSIKNAPKDSAVVIINYNCAGTIKDLANGISGPETNGKPDKGYLYEYARDLRGIIYVNVSPDIILTDRSYLPRAHDDDFSSNSFRGINGPGEYLTGSGITLVDNIKPLYPIMGIKRADTVSKRVLMLITSN